MPSILQYFQKTDQYNNECGINGVLLYSEETERFFQILEGPKKEVIDLYEQKIKKDSRHEQIMEIFHRSTSKPIFFKYTSQFKLIDTHEDLEMIKKYMEEHEYSKNNSKKVLRLLEPFFLFYS